jgi:hypothetical protein
MAAHFELLVGDVNSKEELFKQKVDRMKDLLTKLNTLTVEEKISLDTYRAAYRTFAESIPQQFTYALGHNEFSKYYNKDGDFDKQEYLETDKCTGLSRLQPCLVSDKNDEKLDEVAEGEED